MDDHAGGVFSQLLAFGLVITLLGLVPGTNNLLVLRTATERGAGAARSVALGASAGILAWSAAAGLGVGGLVVAVPGGLQTVGVAGSLAMVAVGLWSMMRRPAREVMGRPSKGFATGFGVCLANPRTPVVAVSLLPQYAVADAAATSTLALGVVWAAIALLWNGVWVAASRNRLLGNRSRLVQRAGGLLVAGLGGLGLAQAM